MQKWEQLLIKAELAQDIEGGWKIFSINGEEPAEENLDLHPYIRKLGDEGWEIVSYQSLPHYAESYMLKRAQRMREAEKQRWEYGYIKLEDNQPLIGDNKRKYYWVVLTPSGLQEERIGEERSSLDGPGKFYFESLPKFIAQLGLEGWEAFGTLYAGWGGGVKRGLTFKRPIEE